MKKQSNPIPWNEWQTILAHCYAHGTMLDADPYEMKNLVFLEEYNDKKLQMRELLHRQQVQTQDPVSLEHLIPHNCPV